MNIYTYSDVRKYLRDWMKKRPRGGHGEFRKLAQYLEGEHTRLAFYLTYLPTNLGQVPVNPFLN
ncbi:MAG: hypothetical protein COT74_04095 [Bdellovibrionales bacterium CG10_big_fil_rev_8_21_14_0_10_45_34]|nr:MAG: hypothetical protein COT74_04095 [Bdellovibrionales bacterium CG10_big_fil_rev_8_21_14_0_10_45_34]